MSFGCTMPKTALLLLLASSLAGRCAGQDPATGWMAYAVGKLPEGYERITKLSMTWKVGASASPSRAFYSPWFGMDPDDNLNLIQPVNPWSGSAWSMCKVSPPTHPPCMRNHLKSL